MAWIKQPDGTYIKQETTEVVNLEQLKQEIKKIEEKIENLEKEKLQYPEGADEKIKQAIDMWNYQNITIEQNILIGELSIKQSILNEIENGNNN